MNNCPNCGNKVKEGSNYCTNCGEMLTGVNAGNKKSKIAAGILGIFLGFLGVHNFYLGYNGKAVGQLLISVCSCFLLSWVSWIWGLVEGICILTGSIDKDANGNRLID